MVWSGIQFLFSKYGNDFFLAMVTSIIFYLMVVYFPTKKANNNTKEFIKNFYKANKKEIIEHVCEALRRRISLQDMNQNLMNYNFIREQITDDDMSNLRSLDEIKIKQVAEEINYSLNQLLNHISFELSQNYIRENEFANRRLRLLSNWILEFGHSMKATTNQEYDKDFIKYIDDYVRGISQTNGPRDHDDFEDYIEKAYQNSLISKKIINLIKKPICILKKAN